jgi:hypothetical protein
MKLVKEGDCGEVRGRAMEGGNRAAAGRGEFVRLEGVLPQAVVQLERRIGEDGRAGVRVDRGGGPAGRAWPTR